MNKKIANAGQLYCLLSEVAWALQYCDPEGDSEGEAAITSHVAQEIIAILEDAGYPVSVIKRSGRYPLHGREYTMSLSHMFLNHEYGSVITTVQEILAGNKKKSELVRRKGVRVARHL